MPLCLACSRELKKKDKAVCNIVINVEKKLMFLEQYNDDLHNLLRNCCITCLNSMDSDLDGEVEATKHRRQLEQRHVNQKHQIIVLGEDSQECKDIIKRFNESITGNNVDIIRIEKNINPKLIKTYDIFKNNNTGNEKLLFHGSRHENYMKILTTGFDIKLSKDGMQGVGIYFATNSSYSLSYAETLRLKNNGTCVGNMLLCRVFVTSDTGESQSNYCTRSDKQCYPEYVIYFNRS